MIGKKYGKIEILNDHSIKILVVNPKGEDFSLSDIKLSLNGEPLTLTELKKGKKSYLLGVKEELVIGEYSMSIKEEEVNLLYNQDLIDEKFYTDEELGVIFTEEGIEFRLWAPFAEYVELDIYDKNDQYLNIKKIKLEKTEKIWKTYVKGFELEGFFYSYRVKNYGFEEKTVLDPYAKSMAPTNIWSARMNESPDLVGKGAIVNLAKTKRDYTFGEIEGFTGKREDAIIYEVHIRDFTSLEGEEKNLKNKQGSFLAFIEKLDYISSLGVTHVQLLPVMNYYYGDENDQNMEQGYSTINNNYNWGYDPHSYFAPEGVYSSNPMDPYSRIDELKMVIDEIHKRGMGVLLDVVYTHMARWEILGDIVPGYYFFTSDDGKVVGGFGNNLATTQKMACRIMHDSIKYWIEEYKVDGFRFDMMGDAHSDSIEEAYKIAKSLNPKNLFVGEGWVTFAGYNYGAVGADQKWAKNTSSVAMFSDDFRNILKSGFNMEGTPKFLTNGKTDISALFSSIKAQPLNFYADEPGDVLQYIEAHDNLTLHDVIALSMRYNTKDNEEDIQKRIRLGNTILLTSQGAAFIHAGQEYGRTKEWKDETKKPEHKFYIEDFGTFIHDSYDSTDKINSFDWNFLNDKMKRTTMEYTKNLIKLRRENSLFRLSTRSDVDKFVKLLKVEEIKRKDLAIIYEISRENESFVVIVNSDKNKRKFTLPKVMSEYSLISDGENFNLSGIISDKVKVTGNMLEVEGLTPLIYMKKNN